MSDARQQQFENFGYALGQVLALREATLHAERLMAQYKSGRRSRPAALVLLQPARTILALASGSCKTAEEVLHRARWGSTRAIYRDAYDWYEQAVADYLTTVDELNELLRAASLSTASDYRRRCSPPDR